MNAPSPGPNDRPLPAPSDGDVFFEGSSHLRIVRHLEQAILQDDRLTVLTGDEGVGKTTVVQRLLRGLDPGAVWWVLVSAPQLDAAELPGSLARAFGVPAAAAGSSAAERQADLRRQLASLAAGRTVLAVIDEAHGLPPEAVAELDDLTREGPLRVLLVGRSALRMNLQSRLPLHPASLSCHLEPLPADETPGYVEHRLRRLGWGGTPEFTDEARALIHRFSRGVPLRINRLCDRLWRAARQRGERTIGADAVQRIARPQVDAAAIPMLTSAIDEPLASGWFAASELPPESELPRWAGPAAQPDAKARQRRVTRLAAIAATGVVVCALAVWVWRASQPPKPEAAPMAVRPVAESPAPSAQAPVAPVVATPTPRATPAAAAPAKTKTPPAAAAVERPRPAPAPQRDTATAAATPTRPANRNGTPAAAPTPVPGPCTATVAALGLCTPTGNAP